MVQIILAFIPFLIFVAVFFFSLWDRKKKETFSESHFKSFLPAIFTHTFDSTVDIDLAGRSVEAGGYIIQKTGEKLLFQNASTLEKYRNWLWSYGSLRKKSDHTIQCKLYVNTGAVITVPAALLVVGFYGLLVQNNIPAERVSIFPYFFLGFGFFFATSSFISQTIKERNHLRNLILKH